MSLKFNQLSLSLILFLFIPLAAINVSALEIGIAFDPPSDDRIVGYKIYYGQSDSLENVIDIGQANDYRFSDLQAGATYCFAAKSYDGNGVQSEFSNLIHYNVPADPFTDSDGDGVPDDEDLCPDDPEKTSPGACGCGVPDTDADNNGVADCSDESTNIMETGEIAIDHNWTIVTFDRAFVDPVVVANPASLNGPDPGVVRIRNVSKDGFEIRLQEWEYLDGTHTYENVSYIAVEKGSYILPGDIMVEAGIFDADGTGFKSNSFKSSFRKKPVVAASVTSMNDNDAVVGRIRNVGLDGFEIRLQKQELTKNDHDAESVSYIAWEPSTGSLNGVDFEVRISDAGIDHSPRKIQFGNSFTKVPLVIADMQTCNGLDTANLRVVKKNSADLSLVVHEEQSRDDEMNHVAEIIGYIALELSASDDHTEQIEIEAEEGLISEPMRISRDSEASGGEYIEVPDSNGNNGDPQIDSGYAQYRFNVPVSGDYVIEGRVLAPNAGSDSFFVSVDNGEFLAWHVLETSTWAWDVVSEREWNDIRDKSSPMVYNLAKGEHTLTIKYREDATKLDKILVTSKSDFLQ